MIVNLSYLHGPPPPALRAAHLASLTEPQELYLERRVSRGATWLVAVGDGEPGYAVVDEGLIVELFYDEAVIPVPARLLAELKATAGVAGCIYQSFDLRAGRLAESVQASAETIGILFRAIPDPHHRLRTDVSLRPAEPADIPAPCGAG